MDGTPQPPPPNPDIKLPETTPDPLKQMKTTSLKLCFCPLCDHQTILSDKQTTDWLYLSRMIVHCVKQKHQKEFVSIDTDIVPYIFDHMSFFSTLEKFKCPPQQWTAALIEQFANEDVFILSQSKREVKLKIERFVWNEDGDVLQEVSASSNVEENGNQNETVQIQDELRESYQKTLQIAKVAYLTCQKALYVYTDEASKSNILAQMEELQKVITETNYLLSFFQK